MTDGGDKPEKPDPFAPLPLANLPPVRKRGDEASGPVQAPPPGRTKSPSIPPTAFVQTEKPPPEPDPEPLSLGPSGAAPEPAMTWETPAGASWSSAPEPRPQEAWTEAAVAAAPADAPLLPPVYSENDLREAAGVTPKVEPKAKAKPRKPQKPPPDDDDDDDGGDGRGGKRKSRKMMFVAALSIFVGSGIAALVFLGKANSARYVIACEAERVVVAQGRSFPPWGTSELDGAEWKALKIPPESPCHPQETEDETELARWYLKILVDQATNLLTAREVTKVDEAEGVLKQALLVTRSLRTSDDAKNARGEIDRLLGDVVYWRASTRLKSASDTLADAAKQFDAAAAQRPAHFNDAAEWAAYSRKLMEQLRAGPKGMPAATFPPIPPSERPLAPVGSALPVEPDAGSGAPAEPPQQQPDAGVPTGGVLL